MFPAQVTPSNSNQRRKKNPESLVMFYDFFSKVCTLRTITYWKGKDCIKILLMLQIEYSACRGLLPAPLQHARVYFSLIGLPARTTLLVLLSSGPI